MAYGRDGLIAIAGRFFIHGREAADIYTAMRKHVGLQRINSTYRLHQNNTPRSLVLEDIVHCHIKMTNRSVEAMYLYCILYVLHI